LTFDFELHLDGGLEHGEAAMLTENFVAATLTTSKPSQHLGTTLKDVGIFAHEFQPQLAFRHGYKKTSVQPQCVAISDSHIFAAQAEKAVINVYSCEKGNQEATIPLPDRVRSIAFANEAAILVIGTEEGKLILWEVANGRLSTSTASHLQGVSQLCITPNNEYILSGSEDATIFVWSLAKLVSLKASDASFGNESPFNAPVGTFSSHREPITALACGHSRPNTNFAVSASSDQTCYLWHIETCEIIRTVLLPSAPICVAVDPVDRAVYLGDDAGGICFVDVLSKSVQDQKDGLYSATVPLQLNEKDRWQPVGDLGAAKCLTLSYDGTSLLSGHANGAIVQWDVAKRRMASELTSLAQPVTNIQMLKPDGLQTRRLSAYAMSMVVKPKLEFSTETNNGTSGVPAKYDFHASLTGNRRLGEEDLREDDLKAITGNGWPDSILGDAVRALDVGSIAFAASSDNDLNEVKVGRLEEELVDTKQRLAALQAVEERRNARKIDRMARRDDVGASRRAAYFEAKRQGKDGDAAMKVWEVEEDKIDAESDNEALPDKMDMT
jgi:pre-rRNA-processing protein IPI3